MNSQFCEVIALKNRILQLSERLPACCDVSVNVYRIYPTPPLGKDMTQGQFLSGVEQV